MRIRSVLLAIFIPLITAANTPQKVAPRILEIKSRDWYQQQAQLWKELLANDRTRAEAWMNYYLASRFSQADASVLSQIKTDIERAVPGTFESLVISGIHHGLTEQGFDFFLKAHRLQPDDALTFGPLIIQAEYYGDALTRKSFGEKLFRSGMVSSSLLNYSYNVLMSTAPGGFLFVDSENTAIPLFVLQDVLAVRQDVVILYVDLLVSEEYREKKLARSGLTLDNVLLATPQELCALVPAQNPAKSFFYALTLARENIVSIRDQLYVVGLASRLSPFRIDNVSEIRRNLETRFLTDYLTVDFNGENPDATGKVFSANYLVPMLLLMDDYVAKGESEKAEQLRGLVSGIANATGKTELVQNFLSRDKQASQSISVPWNLNIRNIEGIFKPVFQNVYAQEYEVTNSQYNEFLQYLTNNKLTDLYEKCKIQLDQYEEPALSFMKGYHSNRQPTRKEKYFSNYPVVNITYEAALEYCNWMTEQYNNSADRKYTKVKFRLPSLREWQLAAMGAEAPVSWNLNENSVEVKLFENGKASGKKYEKKTVKLDDPEILYPWFVNWNFRNRDLNERGCALGNFKYPENQRPCVPTKQNTADGFLLMSPVQAYFPNNIGLYDVVGNVAEMIADPGKACGGSWNLQPAESTVRSVSEFSKAQSDVGFRVFMEIIER